MYYAEIGRDGIHILRAWNIDYCGDTLYFDSIADCMAYWLKETM